MGVSVHMPMRIRLPPGACSVLDGDGLDASVAEGLARALTQAQAEVFAPRGGYAQPRPRPPTFSWIDHDRCISPDQRAAVEARLAGLIRKALDQQGLGEPVEAPEVLPDLAFERLDWRRMHAGRYHVHSYDGPPAEEGVPADPAAPGRTADPGLETGWWFWDGQGPTLAQQVGPLLDDLRTRTSLPSVAGFLFRGRQDAATGFFVLTFRVEGSGQSARFQNARLSFIGAQFNSVEQGAVKTWGLPFDGPMQIDRVGSYSGAADLRQLIRPIFMRHYNLPETVTPGESADEAQRRALVEGVLENFVATVGSIQGLFVVRLSNGVLTVIKQGAMQGQSSITVEPITAQVARSETGEGAGGGGGADKAGDGSGEGAPGGPSGSPMGREEPTGEAKSRASLYPRIDVGGEKLELDLSPFLEEPNVNDLGQVGQLLKRGIRRIAYRLEMPEGEYCGAFLIAAAQVYSARSGLVGQAAITMPRTTQAVEPGTGNLGDVNIVPEHSPAVQLLRFIAGTAPLITDLTRTMGQVYSIPNISKAHFGRYKGRPSGWMLHFHMEHTPLMKEAIGHHYMRACQVVMLQVLRASESEIALRLDNFDRYFDVFSGLMTGFVADEAYLRELRDSLTRVESVLDPSLQSTVGVAYSNWREARQALSTSISDQILNASELADGPDLPKGEPRKRPDGSWVIRDRTGRDWTRAELEAAIAIRNGTATAIDPLISQLTHIPNVADMFGNRPRFARAYLFSLLSEMKANNARIQREATASAIYAFRSGKIREDLPNSTVPGTSVALQGIHLLAHQVVGDAFEGDRWYGLGLDWVFGVELGRQALTAFFEITLVISLSILCPPAGAALGVAIAAVHVEQAEERLTIARSVMNPDDLYDRAELELDLFLAELETVLSVLPEAGAIARGASRGVSIIAKHGLRRGALRLGLQARRALVRSVAAQVKRGLPQAFAHVIVTDRMLALILPEVLGPVIAAVEAEVRLHTAPVPTPAAPGAVQAAEPVDAPLSPEGIAFFARVDEYSPSADEEVRSPVADQP